MPSQPSAFQPAMNVGGVQAQQREVQRLLGRCLLRLQQYERLMKAIVAHHDISGPAHALEEIRAARIKERGSEQQPSKYGCASWRQVLHESRLFELRYRDVDGQRAAWYRVRPK